MVDRYHHTHLGLSHLGMYSDANGEWVRHADYAALLAERDALAAQVEAMKGLPTYMCRGIAPDGGTCWLEVSKEIFELLEVLGQPAELRRIAYVPVDTARQETK